MNQQRLDPLLNTEVTPQQLRKIDPTLYYVIQPTQQKINTNKIEKGILLAYAKRPIDLEILFYNQGLNLNSYYILEPKYNRANIKPHITTPILDTPSLSMHISPRKR